MFKKINFNNEYIIMLIFGLVGAIIFASLWPINVLKYHGLLGWLIGIIFIIVIYKSIEIIGRLSLKTKVRLIFPLFFLIKIAIYFIFIGGILLINFLTVENRDWTILDLALKQINFFVFVAATAILPISLFIKEIFKKTMQRRKNEWNNKQPKSVD